jgi:hypothetical protein
MATYWIEPPVSSVAEDSPEAVGPPFEGSDASVDDVLETAMSVSAHAAGHARQRA